MILTLIILLGIIIRIFYILPFYPNCINEITALNLATASDFFGQSMQTFGNLDQAPLRYFIWYLFLHLGRDPFIIQLIPFIFGISSIFIIYLLGSLMFNRKVAMLSAFLLSISLWHIKHSCYAENYTLYAFTALLFIYFSQYNLKNSTMASYILTIISALLGFYGFYPFLTIILITYAYIFYTVKNNKTKTKKHLFSFIVVIFLTLPGFIQAYKAFLWKQNWGDLNWGFDILSLIGIFGGISNFIPINIIIFICGFIISYKNNLDKKKGLLLFLLTTIPSLFFLCCFLIFKINLADRYFLFTFPFFILLSAYCIISYKNTVLQVLCVICFNISIFLYPISKQNIPNDYEIYTANYRFVCNFFKQNYETNDAIIINRIHLLGMHYYLETKNFHPVYRLPYKKNNLHYNGNKIKNVFGLHDYTPIDDYISTLKEHQRLWVIDYCDRLQISDNNTIITWLNNNYTNKILFHGGIIYLIKNQTNKQKQINEQYHEYKMNKAIAIKYPFQK